MTPIRAAFGKAFVFFVPGFATELGLPGATEPAPAVPAALSGVAGENPMAFFTALQIIAREKGFSMMSKI